MKKKTNLPNVTVGQLYTNHASQLQLKLLAACFNRLYHFYDVLES